MGRIEGAYRACRRGRDVVDAVSQSVGHRLSLVRELDVDAYKANPAFFIAEPNQKTGHCPSSSLTILLAVRTIRHSGGANEWVNEQAPA